VQALGLLEVVSFDLHVLGMPPAFILSQDQTLQKNKYLILKISIILIVFSLLLKIDVLLSFQRT